jgi:hypothetical protein
VKYVYTVMTAFLSKPLSICKTCFPSDKQSIYEKVVELFLWDDFMQQGGNFNFLAICFFEWLSQELRMAYTHCMNKWFRISHFKHSFTRSCVSQSPL